MPAVQKRTFVLPSEEASYIDSLVTSGAYASRERSRDVRDCTRYRIADDDIEHWLREEVVPVYDAMKADPSRGLSSRKSTLRSRSAIAERTRNAQVKRRVVFSPAARSDLLQIYDYVSDRSGEERGARLLSSDQGLIA